MSRLSTLLLQHFALNTLKQNRKEFHRQTRGKCGKKGEEGGAETVSNRITSKSTALATKYARQVSGGRGAVVAGNGAKNDELKSLQTVATLRFGCRLPCLPRCMPQNQLKQRQAQQPYLLPPTPLPCYHPLTPSGALKLSKAVKVAFGLRQLNWVTA